MKIQVLESKQEKLDLDELNAYLTKIVLSRSDEEIKKRKQIYLNKKKQLSTIRSDLKNRKKELSELQKAYSKEKAISRILNTVSALNREGVLATQRKLREQIKKLLPELPNMKVNSLMDLQEKLYVYLPDNIH
ncbi:MAG: hypothetical protein ACOCQD_00505 [archaeon]